VAGKIGTGKMTGPRILTIGHSNHGLAQFLTLLKGAQVSAIADVRSRPVSRSTASRFRRPWPSTGSRTGSWAASWADGPAIWR